MASSSQLSAETSPQKLKEAHHKGWLAGVALRLGCGSMSRNPYERDSEEYLYWNMGFDEGFAG
jgi:hypothetical protein